MIKLSICIPTYNRMEYLKKQIDFFLPYLEKNENEIELIVSDNCSNDGTFEYLNSILLQNKNIIINTNKSNEGLVGNLRIVTGMASGMYIWVVGDDDQLFDGTVEKVLDIISANPTVGHIFLNYITDIDDEHYSGPIYSGKTGFFKSGFEMFSAITEKSTLGANMFLTANIFLAKSMAEANYIVDKYDESKNLALPLGWAAFSSKFPGYIEESVCLKDRIADVSWSDAKTRVFYRDQIAICNKISVKMGIEDKMNRLLIYNMPSTYSFIKFALLNKENLDNFVGKWMWYNFRIIYIKQILFFPFYVIKIVCRRMIKLLEDLIK